MIPRTSARLGFGIEAECDQLQHIDERIDRTHRTLIINVIVDAGRKKRRLLPAQTFDEARL